MRAKHVTSKHVTLMIKSHQIKLQTGSSVGINEAMACAGLTIANEYYRGPRYIEDKVVIAKSLGYLVFCATVGAIQDTCNGRCWCVYKDSDGWYCARID